MVCVLHRGRPTKCLEQRNEQKRALSARTTNKVSRGRWTALDVHMRVHARIRRDLEYLLSGNERVGVEMMRGNAGTVQRAQKGTRIELDLSAVFWHISEQITGEAL